jgi:ketosteroid isomerase-like protein
MEQVQTEKTNLELIRDRFAAFEAGDMETLMKGFSPEVHYHFPVPDLTRTDYHGPLEVRELFEALVRNSDSTLRLEVQSMAASGDRVFVLYRATGARGGKTLDHTSVLVFTLIKGAITEAVKFDSDFSASAAFWS